MANNQLTGAAPLGSVGLDWQLAGFAVDPSTTSNASVTDSSQVAQLVQAMAGFGGAIKRGKPQGQSASRYRPRSCCVPTR